MKKKPNFTFRAIKNGTVVDRCQTHSIRRFYHRIRTIKWQTGIETVCLRVSYGKSLDIFGKMTNFYNDGDYKNKNDLLLALEAFVEVI